MNSQVNPHSINDTEILARYQRAAVLEDHSSKNTLAFNTTLYPHWITGRSAFWYKQEQLDGFNVRLFDIESNSNQPAFDHDALSAALSEVACEEVSAHQLPLVGLHINPTLNALIFSAFGQHWHYDCQTKICSQVDALPEQWKISPDGKRAAFVRDHNLWVRDLSSGEETALTDDGERYCDYALSQTLLSHGFHQPSVSVEAIWSPDSQRLFTLKIDIRHLEVGPPIVQHVPRDGSLRPKILRPDRRVAFSGDEQIACYEFLCIDIASGTIVPAKHRPCPLMYPPYVGYFTGRRGWWDADSRHACFIDHERGSKTLDVVKLDTFTGETQTLIRETSETAVTLIPSSHRSTLVMPLPETNELIWFSERSGWAHLYLYELSTGRLKNPITQGDWLVRGVLQVDCKRREVFVQTAGREAGRNPYYCDIVRVNIDTGEMTTIIASDHDYVVCDQRSRISAMQPRAMGVSPCGEYVVATRSRVDQVPVSLLLDRNGNTLSTVETADISCLPEHWQWPEPVMVKAADGKTDIMAVVFRPSDFDPTQSYPIIDHSYGQVSPIGSFSNSPGGSRQYMSPMACAELGFIVVVVHNRGKDGLRNVAFNDFEDPNFPEVPFFSAKAPLSDSVAAIKQLAKRYPYMDVNRVGAMESCSQPVALSAMLAYADFYKVGVSNNACANSRMLAAQGMLPIDETYPSLEKLAENLQGKLLIMSGMLEWAMPIAMTFRLIEALQKANKRFDMLLLPNVGHGRNNFMIQRSWDYMVEHLLGLTPPDDFKLEVSRGAIMDEEVAILEQDYEG